MSLLSGVSSYAGFFIAVAVSSFVLFTVVSFILTSLLNALVKRPIKIKGFVKENARKVSVFSFLNALSATFLIASRLANLNPGDLGSAIIAPLIIIAFTLAATTALWGLVLVIDILRTARKAKIN